MPQIVANSAKRAKRGYKSPRLSQIRLKERKEGYKCPRLSGIQLKERKEGYESRKWLRFQPEPPNERYKSRRLSQSAILPILLKAQPALLAISVHPTEPSQTINKQAGE